MTVLYDEVVDRPFDEVPESPAKPDYKVAFKRARAKFSQDQCTDVAASLTYYSVQSLFPGLIAVISLLNIFGSGKETTTSLVESIGRIIGKEPSELSTITTFIDNVQAAPGGGLALIIGIGGALWSASGYVGAFGRALNRIYAVEEGRSFVKLKGTLVLITAIEVLLIIMVMASLVLSGPVAKEVGSTIGLGDTAVQVWDIAKWPVVAMIVIAIITMLYQSTPNVRRERSLLTSGAMVGFLVWVLASLALVTYIGITAGASYQKTYGAFAGVIIFLLWLWITNVAMLFGAELDAELLRTRQLKSGLPAERLILLPARDENGIEKKTEKDEKLVAEAIDLRMKSIPSTDALARVTGGHNSTAREFGQAMGPSSHGRTGNGSAPVLREPARINGSEARTVAGAPSDNDAAATAAAIEADREQRKQDALIRAAQERKVRDREAAKQAKEQKARAAAEAKAAKEEKAREEAITLDQRWEQVAAVRAQFAPKPSAERDALLAERDARRKAYHAEQSAKVAAARRPEPKGAQSEPTAQTKSFMTGTHEGPATAPAEPSALEREIEAERERRRNDWYAARGL
ncbi:YihY/virulence factor BrkB family protein [Yimella sp. cx-573]|nr:YihY/virulence factor BrkB family protein [Yimella sp. cx-573]